MRHATTAVALASVLAGCATTRDHTQFIESAYREVNPVVAPVRAQTGFTQSLVCMDRMLRAAGIANVHVSSRYFSDPSGKAGTAVDQLVGTALSEMSVESQAFRWVENEVDQLKQDSVQSLSQMLITGDGMTVRAPDIYVYGSVSYIDQNVIGKRKSFGISGPSWDFGTDRDANVSIVSIDMRLGEFKTKSMFPGVHSSNTIATAKAGSGADVGGKITKYGVTFALGKDYTNGTGAAIRTLVEFGMTELIGKWSKLPYWKCLAVDQAHPEFQRELQEWFGDLSVAQRIKVFQAGLAHAGYYSGPADGQESAAFREALVRFQTDKSLLPSGFVNFESYERLIADHVAVDSAGRFMRAEWLKTLHEGSTPRFRFASRVGSDSALAAAEAPARPQAMVVRVSSSRPDATYRVGDAYDLTISVSRGAYLRCYLQDVNRNVSQIYPNRFQPAEYVAGRRAVRVPGDAGAQEFALAFEKEGNEKVLCVGSDTSVAEAMPASWKTAVLEPIAAVQSLDQIEQFAVNALGAGRVGTATLELRARK